ncbi:MAG: hypothetical protein QXE78_07710 [Nitrososphaeria archaeon]
MEKETNIKISEIKNPVYQALGNQLRSEFEWAYADKNLYSTAWIALHLKNIGADEFKKIKTLVRNNINSFRMDELNKFLTTEFILGLCFGTKVVFNKEGKVPIELKKP